MNAFTWVSTSLNLFKVALLLVLLHSYTSLSYRSVNECIKSLIKPFWKDRHIRGIEIVSQIFIIILIFDKQLEIAIQW